jgi:hypothetical protein
MWEWFGFISGDVASAELHWYLGFHFAYQTGTGGSVVKCVLIAIAKGQVFESVKIQKKIAPIKIKFAPGVLLDYWWSPAWVLQD